MFLCSGMAVINSILWRFFQILSLPIFPDSDFNSSGPKVMFLLFVHIVSALFVLIGEFAAEQGKSDESKTGNWITVMFCVIFGVLSLLYLIIRGCRNKLRVQGITVTRMSDPSLNLRILFLWIFGLAVTIQVLINFAIYIQCMTSLPLQTSRVVFSFLSNIILLLFLLIQTGFITYYRNSTFSQVTIVNIASIVILVANIAVWFNTMLSSINVFDLQTNDTIPRYSNESYCFTTSSIQLELGNKLRPFLLPPRLEFCILASSFIISFWRWPLECEQVEIDNSINRANNYYQPYTQSHHGVIGPHVLATMFGVIINIPIFLTQLLLAFVFNWKQEDVFFATHVGQCVSSVCIIIAIYVCSYQLIKQYDNCLIPARLTTNEYILIMTSSGMAAYFMFGLLNALSSPVPKVAFFISRIVGLMETFLQTYFLLKLKRYVTRGKASVLISSTGILMMLKNLSFWFLNSYVNHHITDLDLLLVDRKTWLYIKNILGPVKTFYRFFSGMISYSVYYKFRS